DENGQPATKPGFMLIATQNPPSYSGRREEDPALLRRLYKIKIDWPAYQKPDISSLKKSIENQIAAIQGSKNSDPKFFSKQSIIDQEQNIDTVARNEDLIGKIRLPR
ncbi:MAG TPA: hypothetical protein VJL60_00585, partial [Gammaproteobacteria bacterium]|nr:hypothetical protein [Gammaproteobacteria bacterium]